MNKLIPEKNFLFLPAKSDHQINWTPQKKLSEQNNSRHCASEARMRPFSSLSLFSLFTQTFEMS
jgi:hypothetical protein